MTKNWKSARLGDLAELITKGTTPTSIGFEFAINGPVNFIKVESISLDGSLLPDKFAKIDQACHAALRRSQLRVGDILFSIAGALGRTALVPESALPANTNQALSLIRLKQSPEIFTPFILWVLSSGALLEQIEKAKGGVAQQNLSLAQVQGFSIPLPPFVEQQRIVAILDEAFDGIATAKANAEKSLQNASSLFQVTFRHAMSVGGIGWIHTTVGEQFTLQRGFDITKDQQRPGKVPVVSSGGIKSFHDTAMVKAPGVVIGRKGTLGKVFFLDEDYWPHDTTLWVKEFNENDPRFVFYFLKQLDVMHLDSGAANPALNRNQVHPIEIDWPPVSLQRSIVSKLDYLAEETQRLESLYQQKLTTLDELKNSLLHEAFSGRL